MRALGLLLLIGFSCFGPPVYSDGFGICAWQGEDSEPNPNSPFIKRTGDGPPSVHLRRHDLSGRVQPCGGVVVGARWVLTARHCVEASIWESFDVIFPASDTDTPLRREVSVGICPKGPAQFPKNDVALLLLEKPLPLGTPHAHLAPKRLDFPFPAKISRWPVNLIDEDPELLVSAISITRRTKTPMLVAKLADRNDPVPCGGESGSIVYDPGDGTILGLLSAISGSNGGRPDCNDPETKLYVTPINNWIGWVADTIAACEETPALCVKAE